MNSYEPDIFPDKNPDIGQTIRTNRTSHHHPNPDILGVYISTIYIPCPGMVRGFWQLFLTRTDNGRN